MYASFFSLSLNVLRGLFFFHRDTFLWWGDVSRSGLLMYSIYLCGRPLAGGDY